MTDAQPGNRRDEPVAVFGAHDPERKPWALSDERLPLFAYSDEAGDDHVVTMPAKPNPSLALHFIRQARRTGLEIALAELLEEAIGSDGLDALERELAAMPDPENGQRVMQAIGEKVQRVVMGGLDAPKG